MQTAFLARHSGASVTYLNNVLAAFDRLVAALLGWSGRFTISAECGASRCTFCRWVRGLLGVRHCVGTALGEGRLEK